MVNILELAQDFTVLSQQNVTGDFVDGESFTYTSILSDQVPDDSVEIPKVLQLNIFATNEEGQPIINFFAIAFTNNCDGYPVFEQGNTAGWLRFVSTRTTTMLSHLLRYSSYREFFALVD